MMHPFSNKVARFGILLRRTGRRFHCSYWRRRDCRHYSPVLV